MAISAVLLGAGVPGIGVKKDGEESTGYGTYMDLSSGGPEVPVAPEPPVADFAPAADEKENLVEKGPAAVSTLRSEGAGLLLGFAQSSMSRKISSENLMAAAGAGELVLPRKRSSGDLEASVEGGSGARRPSPAAFQGAAVASVEVPLKV